VTLTHRHLSSLSFGRHWLGATGSVFGRGVCSPGHAAGRREASIGVRVGDRAFPEPKYDLPPDTAAMEAAAIPSGEEPLVGKRAWVHTGTAGLQPGTVRYVGNIAPCPLKYEEEFYEHPFDTEYWVGVELDRAEGLNDGVARNGMRYFSCRTDHGMFVRPEKVDLMRNQLDCDRFTNSTSPRQPSAARTVPRR